MVQLELLLFQLLVLQHVQLLLLQHQHRMRRRLTAAAVPVAPVRPVAAGRPRRATGRNVFP
ncbi:hypothetical protein [Kribbella sp. CA-294648]|uniref:hypothetical protein n=1 Tax=Kribbella sp. CA-294648 TaxID=3239948 RepID=UPI003D89DF3E